ncbi:hypothetical protein L210DRAFT_3523147, partial [Boletus edulis BED1]
EKKERPGSENGWVLKGRSISTGSDIHWATASIRASRCRPSSSIEERVHNAPATFETRNSQGDSRTLPGL